MRKEKAIAILGLLLLCVNSCTAENGKIELTGLEIAKLIRSGLETLKLPNGSYTYQLKCASDGKCTPSEWVLKQNHAWLARADSGLYEATHDTHFLTNATNEMETFLDLCRNDQDLEACRYCNSHALLVYNLTGERKYLERMHSYTVAPADVEPDSMLMPILIHDWVIGERLGYPQNMTALIYSLQMLESRTLPRNPPWYLSKNNQSILVDACWMHWANIEMYKTLREMPPERLNSIFLSETVPVGILVSTYRMKTHNFFVRANYSEVSKSRRMFFFPLSDIEPCVETLLELDNLKDYPDKVEVIEAGWSQEPYYPNQYNFKKDAIDLLQATLDQRWDSVLSPLYNGDNLLLFQGCRPGESGFSCYNNEKNLNDNAYAVWLFSQFPDHKFSVNTDQKVNLFSDGIDDPGFEDYYSEESLKPKQKVVTIINKPKKTTTTHPATTSRPVRSQLPQQINIIFIVLTILLALIAYLVYKKIKK